MYTCKKIGSTQDMNISDMKQLFYMIDYCNGEDGGES